MVVKGVRQRIFAKAFGQFRHLFAILVSKIGGFKLFPCLVSADILQGDRLAVRDLAYPGDFLTDTVNIFLGQIRIHKDRKLFFLIDIVGERGGADRKDTEQRGGGSAYPAVTAGMDAAVKTAGAAGGASARREAATALVTPHASRNRFLQGIRHLGRHGEGFSYLNHIFFIHSVTSLYLMNFC